MAEVTIRNSLSIDAGNLEYSSKPTNFTGSISSVNPKGPVPGALDVTTSGTDVDLSELTTPGYCRIMNLDATNYVTFGIWDGSDFHPLGEILPGETYPIRLSRSIGLGVGTGYENLRLVADTATCIVVVEAFEA